MSDEILCERAIGGFSSPMWSCVRPFGHSGFHERADGMRGARGPEDEERTLAVLRMRLMVGICGNRVESLLGSHELVCDMGAGHTGWHGCESGVGSGTRTSWTERAEGEPQCEHEPYRHFVGGLLTSTCRRCGLDMKL